jgi:PAT family beta-lactamase induction signal transducer AmpG
VIATAIFLQGVSCLLFVIQFMVGHDSGILMLTVGIESFTSGMASAAFIAMISSYCKPPFCAGHYTILYAVGSLSRVLVSSISGVIADCLSWNWLFFITAVTTIPAFAFLITMRKTAQHKDISDEQVILPVTRRNRSS